MATSCNISNCINIYIRHLSTEVTGKSKETLKLKGGTVTEKSMLHNKFVVVPIDKLAVMLLSSLKGTMLKF